MRFPVCAAGLILILLSCAPAAAQIHDNYTFTAVLQYGPFFPPGVWVPVRLEMRNSSASEARGYAMLPIEDDNGGVNIRMQFNAPPHSRVQGATYAYFPRPPEPTVKPPPTVPPITIATWHTENGARVGRCEILGRPVGAPHNEPTDGSTGSLMLAIPGPQMNDSRDSYDTYGFAKFVTDMTGSPVSPATAGDNQAPRERISLIPCSGVIFDGLDPDLLDPGQRLTLVQFITAGGTIIVPAPLGVAEPADSWFASLLPVQIIGRREAKTVGYDDPRLGKGVLKLQEALDVCEAVEGDGTVVLREGNYVHAAYKPVGFGRVIFTSFPINSLDPKDEKVQALWNELLDLDRPSLDWRESQLLDAVLPREEAAPAQPPVAAAPAGAAGADTADGMPQPKKPEEKVSLLEAMIGRPTVPYSRAAMLAIGYVALVLLIQFFVGGPKRPNAFVLTLAAAIIVSIALVAPRAIAALGFTSRNQELVGARLATVDMAPGGGMQRQVITFLGKDDEELGLVAESSDIALRPMVANKHNRPEIRVMPFSAPRAGAFEAKIERVWGAEGTIDPKRRIEATGTFGPDGLKLVVNNAFGHMLQSPMFLWQRHGFSLDSISTGESNIAIAPSSRNQRGEYTNSVTVFTSEVSKLRGQILKAAMKPAQAGTMLTRGSRNVMMLTGWLDEEGTPQMLQPTNVDPLPRVRTEALVRVPVQIAPSPVGSTVRIEPSFTQIVLGENRGLPYDFINGEWIANPQDGTYLFGFRAPRQVGTVRPTKATIDVDVSAPQQTLTIRKGQVSGGKPSENLGGPVVAEWKQTIGRHSVTFDLDANDVDAQGRVWIQLQVQGKQSGGYTDLPVPWHFREFEMGLEAEVVGPPPPPEFEKRSNAVEEKETPPDAD